MRRDRDSREASPAERERRRRRRPALVALAVGLLYGILPVLADRGSWMAWSWRTDAGRVWQLVGGSFDGPAGRGLHTLDLLAVNEGFNVFMGLPRALAADLLQQVGGALGRLAGLGGDRYEAAAEIVQRLGPEGSLWLWLVTTAAVGAALGLLALIAYRAGRRLVVSLNRRTAATPRR